MVEEYSQIEERLEELLQAEREAIRRQRVLSRETRLQEMELEKTQERHKSLMQKVSNARVEVQRRGQLAYDLRTQAKAQQVELDAVRNSCKNERMRIQARMDKVPKSVLESAEEVLKCRTKHMTELEVVNHALQEKLLNLTHKLEREEVEMEILREKHRKVLEEE